MKTLLVTLEYPPFKGGVANYYENIIKNWPKPDDIFVLDNKDGKLISNTKKWLPAIFNIKKEIKQKSINHVIVGNILPLGTVIWILSSFMKLNYSVILHGTDIMYTQKSWRKKMLAKIILKKSNNIICNSKFTAGLVTKYYGNKFKDKICVVNPGIDIGKQITENRKQNFIKKYNLENKFVLFSISRLIKRKGIDRVIEIFPELINKIPNLVYIVAGTGPDEDELKKLAKEKNIIFLGQISEEEKWTWLDVCDIFILPSREDEGNIEGFGIVYLEANLKEKPVIAGNHGGVSDAVIHNQTGLLVNPENKEEIKDAILKLYKNKKLNKKFGKQGKIRVIKKFGSKNQAKEIFDKINV
jgi:phosphatidylinositol alpha-1,6-mannosyltransferase